ncbi:hypothetical protein ACKI14_02580 [Streptomyces turgidiscabies]|uniref:hypothetical protein n=1 Tax=Streptomyces turgidiscabies TaxID=85558 RepID=UPI0038F82023
MTYFQLRKRDPEDEPDEAVDEEETGEEEAVDEAPPPAPAGLLGALWMGFCGPGHWLTAHGRAGAAWVLYPGSVWAVGYYGGWTAIGVPAAWLVLVVLFMPREFKDRVSAWIERRIAGPASAGEEAAVPPIVTVMWKLIGDAPGVHLKTLAAALQKAAPEGAEEVVDKAAVRAKLGALNIPLRGSVRDAAGKVNEGVHRDDLKAWMEALPSAAPGTPPDPRSGPVATPVTCDVEKRRAPVATPLPRLRRLLSRGAG